MARKKKLELPKDKLTVPVDKIDGSIEKEQQASTEELSSQEETSSVQETNPAEANIDHETPENLEKTVQEVIEDITDEQVSEEIPDYSMDPSQNYKNEHEASSEENKIYSPVSEYQKQEPPPKKSKKDGPAGKQKTEEIRELVKSRDFYNLVDFKHMDKDLIRDIKRYEKKYENTDV